MQGNSPKTQEFFIVEFTLQPIGDGIPLDFDLPDNAYYKDFSKKGFDICDIQRKDIRKYTFWAYNNEFTPSDNTS